MIAVIDNYDSFVHNLARYIRLCGEETVIFRNDAIDAKALHSLKPDAIVISPGPCSPAQSGNSLHIINALGAQIPILGVCLGHQCIGSYAGGKITIAEKPTHGKPSTITHNGHSLFKNIPNPFIAGRYHSLIVELTEQSDLQITAKTSDNIIMAFEHKKRPLYGVQFHPESILTEHGLPLIQNFITLAKEYKNDRLV